MVARPPGDGLCRRRRRALRRPADAAGRLRGLGRPPDATCPPGRAPRSPSTTATSTPSSRCARAGHDIVHINAVHHLPFACARLWSDSVVTATLHSPPTPWLESALAPRHAPRRPAVDRLRVARQRRRVAAPGDRRRDPQRRRSPPLACRAGRRRRRVVGSARPGEGPAPRDRRRPARRRAADADGAGPRRGRTSTARSRRAWAATSAMPATWRPPSVAAVVGHSAVAFVTPAWDEPFGLVVAEAMACGTPIAAFDRGAIAELIDAETGRAVRARRRRRAGDGDDRGGHARPVGVPSASRAALLVRADGEPLRELVPVTAQRSAGGLMAAVVHHPARHPYVDNLWPGAAAVAVSVWDVDGAPGRRCSTRAPPLRVRGPRRGRGCGVGCVATTRRDRPRAHRPRSRQPAPAGAGAVPPHRRRAGPVGGRRDHVDAERGRHPAAPDRRRRHRHPPPACRAARRHRPPPPPAAGPVRHLRARRQLPAEPRPRRHRTARRPAAAVPGARPCPPERAGVDARRPAPPRRDRPAAPRRPAPASTTHELWDRASPAPSWSCSPTGGAPTRACSKQLTISAHRSSPRRSVGTATRAPTRTTTTRLTPSSEQSWAHRRSPSTTGDGSATAYDVVSPRSTAPSGRGSRRERHRPVVPPRSRCGTPRPRRRRRAEAGPAGRRRRRPRDRRPRGGAARRARRRSAERCSDAAAVDDGTVAPRPGVPSNSGGGWPRWRRSIDAHGCTTAVVDVSVEVTVMARLHGLRVVTVRQSGARGDAGPPDRARQRRRGLGAAAPGARAARRRDRRTVAVHRGVQPARRHAATTRCPPGCVSARGAARRRPVERRSTTAPGARATAPAGWDVVIAGTAHRWRRCGVASVGRRRRRRPACSRAADVVVASAGWAAVADATAAGARLALVAEDRPFDEQATRVRALAAAGLAVDTGGWPAPDELEGVLAAAQRLDPERWAAVLRPQRCAARRRPRRRGARRHDDRRGHHHGTPRRTPRPRAHRPRRPDPPSRPDRRRGHGRQRRPFAPTAARGPADRHGRATPRRSRSAPPATPVRTPPGATVTIFLDVDCIPHRRLVADYDAALAEHPGALACGRVRYLRRGLARHDA